MVILGTAIIKHLVLGQLGQLSRNNKGEKQRNSSHADVLGVVQCTGQGVLQIMALLPEVAACACSTFSFWFSLA